MRVINVDNFVRTEVAGVFDCNVTFVPRYGAQTEKHPHTYNPGDPTRLTPLITKWLASHNVVPAKIAAAYVPPTPTAGMVKKEAQRRIELLWPMYKQLNTMRRGTPEEVNLMGAEIDVLRQKSRALEETLPPDYQHDKHWT